MQTIPLFNQKILLVLNTIFHPVFLPIWISVWYFYLPNHHYPLIYNALLPASIKNKWTLLYVSLYSIMPVIVLFMSKIFRVVDSIELHSSKDRRYFFLLIGVYYWVLSYMLKDTLLKDLFKPFILLINSTSVIMLLLSLFTFPAFKTSLHAAGYGLLTAFFITLTFMFTDNYLYEITLSVILSAVVMILRLISHAHHFSELLAGWALGFFSCIFVFVIVYQ